MLQSTLALDIGLKRIGVAAISNAIALPLAPIHRQNRIQASKEICQILEDRAVEILVVGLPTESMDTQNRIKHFISLLDFQGKIIYIDEDYTSVESISMLSHQKKKSKEASQKNGVIDSISALQILNRYISQYKVIK